jgi:protein involved in temperature-dependent protein secretion
MDETKPLPKTPREALAAGRLDDALEWQQSVVKHHPQDPAARLFLMELLVAVGDLNRAIDELCQIKSDEPGWPESRRYFRRLIVAIHRRNGRKPNFFGPPPEHARYRWHAIRAIREGQIRKAEMRIDRADASSIAIKGHVDGREFEGLRDSDDRFGSVLEAFLEKDYLWVPFEIITRLTLLPAAGLVDNLYRPAMLTIVASEPVRVVVPLVYPDSETRRDEFSLGMDVDMIDAGGPALGIGARVWLVGEEELLLADCQQFDLLPMK